jgi:DNA recombination protein RmuC
MMTILFLTIGLGLGYLIAFLLNKQQLTRLETQLKMNENALQKNGHELERLRQLELDKTTLIAKLEAEKVSLLFQLSEQKEALGILNQKMQLEFENLANKILDEKAKKFTDQNQQNLTQILSPLKERIKDFEDKVQRHYDEENREKASLKQQITMLHELNQKMSTDAQNLTKALKGDTKTQGNWGEFILESILEKSGLQKDREFTVQASMVGEEGKRYQPDVLIHLPESKVLIIDSKVSLVAYEKFISSDDEAFMQLALKEHLQSIRNHLKGLSDKKYQQLQFGKTLDFVLMFIPIEPAFAMAVQHDGQLFNEAFEKNIVIVSPTTLLATLRTVANIWKQEKQTRHAIEIASKAGDLYDKFHGFIEDMIDLGKRMDASKTTYENAMKRLSTGRGNVIRQVEELKRMGANASKQLPSGLIDRAMEE